MSTKPLPDGWSALVDSAGKTYYANSKTGASSWFHPAEVVSSGGAARAAVGASKSEAETKATTLERRLATLRGERDVAAEARATAQANLAAAQAAAANAANAAQSAQQRASSAASEAHGLAAAVAAQGEALALAKAAADDERKLEGSIVEALNKAGEQRNLEGQRQAVAQQQQEEAVSAAQQAANAASTAAQLAGDAARRGEELRAAAKATAGLAERAKQDLAARRDERQRLADQAVSDRDSAKQAAAAAAKARAARAASEKAARDAREALAAPEAAEAKAYGEANERASKLLDAQGQLSWLRKTTQEIEYAQRQTTEAAAAAAQRQAQAEEWVAGTMMDASRTPRTAHATSSSPRHFSPSQDSSATRAPI